MTPVVEAILLGALQGITEFLPVSSSGHLALAQLLMGVREPGLTLSVVLHAGTLAATLLLVRERVTPLVRDGLAALTAPKRLTETSGGRDLLVVLLVSIPTGIIGLLSRQLVADLSGSPLVLSLGFLITTALLISTRFSPAGAREVPSHLGAVLIGITQGIAVLPGISRSGATIAVALWLGVKPARAFELSMLMSIPAVLGALALEARHLTELGSPGVVLIGALVAFITGALAMVVLRRVVIRNQFAWFAVWVLPMAALAALKA